MSAFARAVGSVVCWVAVLSGAACGQRKGDLKIDFPDLKGWEK